MTRAPGLSARRVRLAGAVALRFRFSRHGGLAVGAVLVLLWAVPAALASWISPYDYSDQRLDAALKPPTAAHFFGTDELGRDVFSRVLFGAQVTLILGLVVVGISGTFGMLVGALSGFLGGWEDELLMRATEVVMAFPSIILAMAIVVALGPSIEHAALAMILVWWPPYARLARGEVLALKRLDFVEAATAIGQRPCRILTRHVLPNIISRVLALATLDIGSAIITGAGLSFLGLGAVPPAPELGAMVSKGRELPTAWWVTLFPGLAILMSVLGLNFMGDSLRDLTDPRRRLY
ncbi:MAG: ABC transporter permease [Armatimonadota bacterium]